jgi:hydroxylaminobenzene mutase
MSSKDETAVLLTRQGHRLIQLGAALLLFAALEGFIIPALPVPHLGLSVHTLAGLEAVIFLALGLTWPRLRLGATAARVAFWTYVYSSFATLVPYTLAALWGAGNTTIHLAAGPARGTPIQETIIKVTLYSAAPTFLVAIVLILYGLRLGRSELFPPPA